MSGIDVTIPGGFNKGQAVSQFLRPGVYHRIPAVVSLSSSNALGVGVLKATAFYVPRPVRLDRIGAEITGIGDVGSLLRLGIYADDAAGGYPGALVLDAGTIDGASVAVQEIAIDLVLTPGVYWAAAVVQAVAAAQPNVRTIGTHAFPLTGSSTILTAAQLGTGYSMAGVAGALPAAFAAAVVLSSFAPSMFARAA